MQAKWQHSLSLSLPQELLTCVIGWLKVLGRFFNKFLGYLNGCKQVRHTHSLSQELLTSVVGRLKVLGRFSNKFLGYLSVCKQMTLLPLSLSLSLKSSYLV
jgi:hypothetical protein